MNDLSRKREVWLAVWTIFIALLIQVIYDWSFSFPVPNKTLLGLFMAALPLAILGYYISNGFSWRLNRKQKPQESNQLTEKEILLKTLEETTKQTIILEDIRKSLEKK